MFQPETEDMLPRMAPKPNTMDEAVVMPQVPEVSILYGPGKTAQEQSPSQQLQNQQARQIEQQKPLQTYANWRKQMLPRVTFPATLDQEPQKAEQLLQSPINHRSQYALDLDHNSIKSTLYPFRIMPSTLPNPNTHSDISTVHANAITGAAFNFNSKGIPQMQCYEILNYPNMCYGQQQHYQQQQKVDLKSEITPPIVFTPALQAKSNNHQHDVLTICAGTQTDSPQQPQRHCESNITWENVACKQDVDNLMAIVQHMREEQIRLLQICETLLINQTMIEQKSLCKDASVQVELNFNDDYGAFEVKSQEIISNNNKLMQEQTINANSGDVYHQTPKGKPIAQSTGYRANTPQIEHNEKAAIVLSKPTTEKSLIMNELAFKYLATDKLTELFHECKLNTTPNNNSNSGNTNNNNKNERIQQYHQLSERNVNNINTVDKTSPTCMTNSSYKYLKKYRLLPEDYVQMENKNEINETAIPKVDNIIINKVDDTEQDLEGNDKNINASPLLHHIQHVATKKYSSPYPLKYGSPSQISSSAKHHYITQTMNDEHMLDLENIKQQAKFL